MCVCVRACMRACVGARVRAGIFVWCCLMRFRFVPFTGTAELRGTLVVNLVNDTLGPRTITVGYVGNLARPFDNVEIVSTNVCIDSRGESLTIDSRSITVLLRQSDATGCGEKKSRVWLVAVLVVGGVLLLALLVGVLGYILYRKRILNKLWHSYGHSYEVNA